MLKVAARQSGPEIRVRQEWTRRRATCVASPGKASVDLACMEISVPEGVLEVLSAESAGNPDQHFEHSQQFSTS
jgi:hypothetical protein